MKRILSINLALVMISISALAQSSAEEQSFEDQDPCYLGSHLDTCLMKSNFGVGPMHMALVYGTLSTEKLVIEVFRADVTDEKLAQLINKLNIKINGTDKKNVDKHGYYSLPLEIEENRIIVPFLDEKLSSLYVSILKIENEEGAIQDEVKRIFGPKSFAIITSIGRRQNH